MALLLSVVGGLLAGCSAPSTFPEQEPCTAPSPSPTASPRGGTSGQYFTEIRRSADGIVTLREQLRAAYPGDKFSRASQFRVDFATYADKTVCLAQFLKGVQPTNPSFAAFDAELEERLQALIDHTLAGREAVRKRNVSEYRDWYGGVDAKIEAVKSAANARSTR